MNRIIIIVVLCIAGFTNKAINATASTDHFKKEAIIADMGWFNASYKSLGYLKDTDFAVYPIRDKQGLSTLAQELRAMQDYGWTAVAPDALFFADNYINAQIRLMKSYHNTIKSEKLEKLKLLPMYELRGDVSILIDGTIKMYNAFSDKSCWLHIDNKPAVLVYGGFGRSAEYWSEAITKLKENNINMFWILEQSGLNAALFGSIKNEEKPQVASICDGVYNFGASGLEACADTTKSFRNAYGDLKCGKYIGGAVWPGYLSARAKNKNFISPRGTEFLRHVWERTLSHKPDFITFSTWDDFHESTTLTYSYSVLSSRLEISQRYLAQYFNTPLPSGQENEPELILSYRKCIYGGEKLKFELLPLPTQKSPAKGVVEIELYNDKNKLIASTKSPVLTLNTGKLEIPWKSWDWSIQGNIDRKNTLTISVYVKVHLLNGKTISYANLPDIAVTPPISYADQLYYSIPLHKLADASRSVSVIINDIKSDKSSFALHNGLKKVRYKINNANKQKAWLASMRDAHPFRLLSSITNYGAEMSMPGDRDGAVVLTSIPKGEKYVWTDWMKSETDIGDDYYAALVKFSDGKWAYSHTIWSKPVISYNDIIGQWIFTPMWKSGGKKLVFPNRVRSNPEIATEKLDAFRVISLKGNNHALQFKGTDYLSLPSKTIPSGPASLEVTFSTDETNSEQVICYQRGAQLSLKIDKNGYLTAFRLPEKRIHPNPYILLKSKFKIKPQQYYQAILVFDGDKFSFYLDGELQALQRSPGTRSTETFTIGGPPPGGNLVNNEVDELSSDSFFKGEIVRLTVYGKALSAGDIKRIYALFTKQAFTNKSNPLL